MCFETLFTVHRIVPFCYFSQQFLNHLFKVFQLYVNSLRSFIFLLSWKFADKRNLRSESREVPQTPRRNSRAPAILTRQRGKTTESRSFYRIRHRDGALSVGTKVSKLETSLGNVSSVRIDRFYAMTVSAPAQNNASEKPSPLIFNEINGEPMTGFR